MEWALILFSLGAGTVFSFNFLDTYLVQGIKLVLNKTTVQNDYFPWTGRYYLRRTKESDLNGM